MKLKYVDIKNFRSIEELRIDFRNHQAIGLVGINESGKTNILRALSLISTDSKPQSVDVREKRAHEDDVRESYVKFHFELAREDIDSIAAALEPHCASKNRTPPIFRQAGQGQSFVDLLLESPAISLHFDLLEQSRSIGWLPKKDDLLVDNGPWHVLRGGTPSAPLTVEIPWESPPSQVIADWVLLRGDDFEGAQLPPGATELSPETLLELLVEVVSGYVDSHLPSGLFWRFEKENLLPSSVPLDEFCKTPSMCKPLQSMFEIAGYRDIQSTIKEKQARGRHQLDNLLHSVAEKSSKHIRDVWKDYDAAKISLQLDGSDIRISVTDEGLKFAFENRSDGYKRFITFLLLVSAKVKTDSLENVLLLIDEPEISLHPAGVRNLRDELLRIAQKNLVVYATHSPQMIDRRHIERHILVRKEREVTKCETVDGSRVFDEEVILNSLGASVFESIRPVNLMFEGWRDKKLFEAFLVGQAGTHKFDELRTVGTCFAGGVKDVRNIIPLLSMTPSKAIVISDDDQPAREARKSFQDSRLEAEWLTYRELEGDPSKAVTAEDFIRPEALRKAFSALCIKHSLDVELTLEELPEYDRLSAVDGKLRRVAKPAELKSLLNEFKSLVFDELVADGVDERYELVADSILSRVRAAG